MKNFYTKTCSAAFEVLLSSTHDIAWAYGPFGESLGSIGCVFIGSSMPLEAAPPNDDAVPAPLPNEASISIDWSLPMTEKAQVMLFQRMVAHWNRTTAGFAVHQRKKYRMTADEILSIRNMMVLFVQIQPHLTTRMGSDQVESWENDLVHTTKRDSDLLALINVRPPNFSLSMLQSEQEQAKACLLDVEQKRIEAKESQQAEVDLAKWNYFKGALKRDHEKMEQAQAAPRLVRQRLHAKQVQHRSKLAAEGEAACKGYQDLGSLFFH